MNHKAIGEIGQCCVIGEFAKLGVDIAIPLSDNLPFDLIAIVNGNMKKVQVKSSSDRTADMIKFSVIKTNFYKKERTQYTSKDCDIFALYNLINHEMYLLDFNDLNGKQSISIRMSPSKNNQITGINFREKYIASTDRISLLFGSEPNKVSDFLTEEKNKDSFKHYDLKCKKCNISFQNMDKNVIFCSQKCSQLNKRKVIRPSLDNIKTLIDSNVSWSEMGRMFEVSDNAVRKWAKQYKLI